MNSGSDQGKPTVFNGALNATLHVTASIFHMQWAPMAWKGRTHR